MQSYNQIIKLNKDFAENHFQIKTFGNGKNSDIVLHDKQDWFSYPLMWMEDLPINVSENEMTFSFRVYFINQVATLKDREGDKIETNLNEVKSDMIQCALDLLSFWEKDVDFYSINLVKSSSIQPIEDELSDRVTGCFVDLRLNQGFRYNKCAIPMTGVTPPPSETCQAATLNINAVTPFDTIVSGGSKTLEVRDTDNDLVGFDDSGVWRVPKGYTLERIYLRPPPTGAVDIYHALDDKAQIDDGVDTYVPPAFGIPMIIDPTNLWKVLPNNLWGHKWRICGDTGGYYDNILDGYYDVNGIATTYALAFPNDKLIDHSTGLEWINQALTKKSVSSATDSIYNQMDAYTNGGDSDYFVANARQLESIKDLGIQWSLYNQPPFNNVGAANKWSSTTAPYSSSTGYSGRITGETVGTSKATTQFTIPMAYRLP